MRISGVLKSDMKTRAKLVDGSGEQMDLLVHVLLNQGREVYVVHDDNGLRGDASLVLFVENSIARGATVPSLTGGPAVLVSLSDSSSIALLLSEVLEEPRIIPEDDHVEGAVSPRL